MKALSSYWAGSSHRALSAGGSVTARLAIALTPVRSIIRVVDDSRPPMAVDWCKVGNDAKGKPLSMSYTDFTGSRIAVNPLPIIENKLSAAAQIDVVAGFALHEASHSKHSRDRWKYLIKKEWDRYSKRESDVPAFQPMRVASYLWNLVEDVRIEAATSRDWRGFAPYFDNLLDWMWTDHLEEDISRKGVGYGPKVEDKLRLVFAACRFPDKAKALAHAESKIPGSENVPAEVEWWQAWQRDYLSDVTDVPTTLKRGLDHLAEDPAAKQEMEQMVKDEKAERLKGEKLRAQIERLMKEGVGNAPSFCITEDGEVRPLTSAETEAVDKLVKEGLVTATPIITHRGSAKPEIRVSKPVETPSSRRAYVGRPDASTEALRAALVFRSERPRYDVKLQRSGELDDEELYRFGLGDDRLFSQHMIESVPDTYFGLLVDLSGSMMDGHGDGYTSKLDTAQRLAQLFLWAAHDMEGVTSAVWGHTGDYEHGQGSDIYRLWEPGDPLSRLGLVSELGHGNNYDGYAIAYCADRMRTAEQPQKVLIVLSDGYPLGSNYGGHEAQNHMRNVCIWARSQGVEVIQIAIADEMRPVDQARMFGEGNYILYVNEKQLPRDLTKILGRFAK